MSELFFYASLGTQYVFGYSTKTGGNPYFCWDFCRYVADFLSVLDNFSGLVYYAGNVTENDTGNILQLYQRWPIQ